MPRTHAPAPAPLQGIASAQLLGLSGPTWRGLDILCAQALLARTLGHAVGAQSSLLLSCLSNLVYPASLLVYAHLLADGVLTLGFASKVGAVRSSGTRGWAGAAPCSMEGWRWLESMPGAARPSTCPPSRRPPQVLLLVLLATLAAKAGLEGFHTLPRYCPHHGKRTLACFAAAFVVFPLPELFPSERQAGSPAVAVSGGAQAASWQAGRQAGCARSDTQQRFRPAPLRRPLLALPLRVAPAAGRGLLPAVQPAGGPAPGARCGLHVRIPGHGCVLALGRLPGGRQRRRQLRAAPRLGAHAAAAGATCGALPAAL